MILGLEKVTSVLQTVDVRKYINTMKDKQKKKTKKICIESL